MSDDIQKNMVNDKGDTMPDIENRLTPVKYAIISLMLVIVSGFIPLFGIALIFISIVPQMVLLLKGLRSQALISWLMVIIAIGLLRSPMFALVYGLLFIAYAFMFTKFIEEKINPNMILLNTALFWCMAVFILSGTYLFFYKVNLLKEFVFFAKLSGGLSVGKYYDLGLPYAQIELIETSVQSVINFFRSSIAGIVVVIGFIGSWTVYNILGRHTSVDMPSPVKSFRLPDNYIWFLIVAAVAYITGRNLSGNNILLLIGSNTGLVICAGYFLSGLAVAASILARITIPAFMKVLILFFVFVFLRGIYIFLIIGLVDVWLDFRKRIGV